MATAPTMVTFTNFGKTHASTLEEARQTHNMTAGDPQGVAAAQVLGDFSHLVFMPSNPSNPSNPSSGWTGDLIFIDQWLSAEGLQQFFADPQVQAGASALFTSYDPVVWHPSEAFAAYHLNAPLGAQDRFVAVVRGVATSLEQASAAMKAAWQPRVLAAHQQGLASHEVFVRLAAPGSPEALEILGIDVWTNAESLGALYEDRDFLRAFDGAFTAEAQTWVLHRPHGDWVEW
jgi:hypothetical protein